MTEDAAIDLILITACLSLTGNRWNLNSSTSTKYVQGQRHMVPSPKMSISSLNRD